MAPSWASEAMWQFHNVAGYPISFHYTVVSLNPPFPAHPSLHKRPPAPWSWTLAEVLGCCRCLNLPYTSSYVAVMFLVCKALYLTNAAFQFFLMNRFLETSEEDAYGWRTVVVWEAPLVPHPSGAKSGVTGPSQWDDLGAHGRLPARHALRLRGLKTPFHTVQG